jgi:SAM-dependent methyltransferase
MASRPEEMAALYGHEVVDRPLFEERYTKLVTMRQHAPRFLEAAGIEYLAPRDAARTALPGHSIDCHYSMTVLEHIPPPALQAILLEARRILKPGGVALHFIDPSDHFEQQDHSITPINFLRYSEEQWQRLAGNRFAYCNRLRASDLLKLGEASGFTVARSEISVDERSRQALREGLVLDPRFAAYPEDDTCATSLRVMWQ